MRERERERDGASVIHGFLCNLSCFITFCSVEGLRQMLDGASSSLPEAQEERAQRPHSRFPSGEYRGDDEDCPEQGHFFSGFKRVFEYNSRYPLHCVPFLCSVAAVAR